MAAIPSMHALIMMQCQTHGQRVYATHIFICNYMATVKSQQLSLGISLSLWMARNFEQDLPVRLDPMHPESLICVV